MMSIFHRAKHWQLFTILVGTVVIFEIVLFTTMFADLTRSQFSHRPPDLSGIMWVFIPMMLIVLGIIFGWQWSIGWGLKDKLPRGVKMKHQRFKAFMIIPFAYFILVMFYMSFLFSGITSAAQSSNPDAAMNEMLPMLAGMIIILPLHLFSMFCMFHNIYFCAKTLKSIELGREAELNDYIGYFFLFWFNIVGMWIIQPSVNRITSGNWTPPGGHLSEDEITPVAPTPHAPQQEVPPRGERLNTKNHDAFNHTDDFDGLI